MLITDLRDIPSNSAIHGAVCIVGSGPAGLTIAAELARMHHDILVIESGAVDREDAFSTALNAIENIGARRELDPQKVRNRTLGGSSHTWSGRCTTLDSIDYESRDWVNCSGWPVAQQEMAPFLHKAAQHLGLKSMEYDEKLFEDLKLPERLEGDDIRPVFWQFSRQSARDPDHVRFGPRFVQLKARNIRVLTNATVTNIATDEEGRIVRELEIATPEGVIHKVRGGIFILCGGGIENARLMLASNRTDPRGVGNRKGLVGRYLMDHPRTVIGTFAPAAVPAIQPHLLLLRHPSGARLQRGVSLSFAVQRRERLLNCAAWVTQHFAEDDVWSALRATRAGLGRKRVEQGRIALHHADQIASGVWDKVALRRPLTRRYKQLDIDVLLEQNPDPDSRITLADTKDALGVPVSKIDWRIGEMERRTVMRLGHAIHDALASAGLPTASLPKWIRERRPEDAVFQDVAHPIGTTRMAKSENDGVVDPNGKVFGIDNLYIAGSSVFPTGGHANPTLMIVALALRLAERLSSLVS